ncbi:MAG: gfo/Idh/MocA family oxidoreductase [Clostridiales bacterium]|nr:MAG: gfo/Idh/MocA family oxidoreductase [Clostridiales bacterium]
MKKINIGILGPSEIAFRRFVPGILKSEKFNLSGIACATEQEWAEKATENNSPVQSEYEKCLKFKDEYGCNIFNSYQDLLKNSDIEAVYIPLPPGLHKKWAEAALLSGKHVLLEKPLTTCYKDTKYLIDLAKDKELALHENFAFIFHKQIEIIDSLLKQNVIGDLRLVRTCFGFPYRGESDFRYYKELGGGSILDCGGYPLKLASHLLGKSTRVVYAKLNHAKNHDVDVFGSATLENDNGLIAQVSFGMDNSYKCELEIWGSEGLLYTPRIFTPPADMEPHIFIHCNEEKDIVVPKDDYFKNSAEHFYDCILNEITRAENYNIIERQGRLFESVLAVRT